MASGEYFRSKADDAGVGSVGFSPGNVASSGGRMTTLTACGVGVRVAVGVIVMSVAHGGEMLGSV